MHTRYFDEFSVGDRFETRAVTISEGMILDFALTYDPQHMHTDKVKSEAGPFGGLIASGFQTMALSFRLFYDLGIVAQSNIVGPGIDNLRWTAPVHVGDTIHAVWEVLDLKPSSSKPDRGTVRWLNTTYNQAGDTIMTYEPIMIVRRFAVDKA